MSVPRGKIRASPTGVGSTRQALTAPYDLTVRRASMNATPDPLSSVPNLDVVLSRFWSRVEKTPTCWIWRGMTNPAGYGRFPYTHAPRDYRTVLAHRFSMLLSDGAFDTELLVCHHCDNPPCVNPAHLFLGTNAENTADRMAKGRPGATYDRHGATNPNRRVSPETVLMIRSSALPTNELALLTGASKSTVEKIRSGRTWRFGPWPEQAAS